MKVAYQGIKGAYSYIVSRRLFPEAQLLGKGSFKAVYESLMNGECQYAVLPIENTVIGSIFEVYDLLFEHHDVVVIGEVQLKVNHNLVGFAQKSQISNPKSQILSQNYHSDLSHVKEIYSHPKALEQCSKLFDELVDTKSVVWEDTAAAAAYVALKGDPSVAAIASKTAARKYGLEVLREKVQDNGENYTRFVVLRISNQNEEILQLSGDSHIARSAQDDKLDLKSLSSLSNKDASRKLFKTSLVFVAAHRPGVLLKCLQPFAEAGLNLTKIESRPLVGKPWQYVFYLDFEHGNLNGRLGRVLEEIEPHTQVLRVLGTYEKGEVIEE